MPRHSLRLRNLLRGSAPLRLHPASPIPFLRAAPNPDSRRRNLQLLQGRHAQPLIRRQSSAAHLLPFHQCCWNTYRAAIAISWGNCCPVGLLCG
ncbi:unnamed protein product [Linum tenue]|uniref:Uncharacterized protein n=1 Tax=Linum tenue TaxID=586396 RepID=A0AAV0QI45_9ROSI|nr:unnamed protein product [Linum tenue]